MSIALLDVNVLIALLDPAHVHHEPAHHWFSRNRKKGWASCPATLNGCVRILSNPKYPSFRVAPAEVIDHLRQFCSDPHHDFWSGGESIVNAEVFRSTSIVSHKNITDVYLLALATKHHGRLATFDGSIPLKAVAGALPANLEWIQPV